MGLWGMESGSQHGGRRLWRRHGAFQKGLEPGLVDSHREVPLRCFGFIWEAWRVLRDAGRTGSDEGYIYKGPPG